MSALTPEVESATLAYQDAVKAAEQARAAWTAAKGKTFAVSAQSAAASRAWRAMQDADDAEAKALTAFKGAVRRAARAK